MAANDLLLSPAAMQAAGYLGAAIYIGNYALLATGILHSARTRFFVVQGVAASLVLLGLTADFNAPSVMIQVFYLSISVVGLAVRLGGGLSAGPRRDARRRSCRHWAGGCRGTGCRDRAPG